MRSSHASASNPFSRNPLFAIAVAFAVGIYLYTGLETDPRLFVFGFIVLLAATFFDVRLQTVLMLAAFVLAGALVAGLDRSGESKTSLKRLYDNGWIASGDPVRVKGKLEDHPQLSVDGVFLSVNVARIEYKKELIHTSGTVRLFLTTVSEASEQCFNALDLKAGNVVQIAARLRRENPYMNPGTVSTIDYLDRRGIHATATLKSCFLIEKKGRGVSILSFAYEFREYLTKRVLLTHDRRTAGIVLASLLGNKNFLTKESGEIFRENGTFHVLIISGLHITLIGGLILLGFRRLTSKKYLQFAASNLCLWGYAVAVGLQLPVFRAALMYSVFLAGYAVNRPVKPLNSLGAACLALLIWRPADLFNPSFQLTFLSIYAIVGFAFPLIEKIRNTGAWMPTTKHPFPPDAGRPFRIFAEALYWSELRWSVYLSKQNWDCGIEKTSLGKLMADTRAQLWIRRLFEIGTVSFSVQLFILPLLILNFHRVGAASIFSNLFAASALVMQNVFSLITLLVSIINIESARSFFSATVWVSDASMLLQELLGRKIFRPFRVPVYTGIPAYLYSFYYVPLGGLLFKAWSWNPFRSSNHRFFGKRLTYFSFAAIVGIAGIIIFHPYSSPAPNGRLRVDFLDVGQGDAALLTFPDGRTLLIDGGGQRDFEPEVVERPDVAGVGERVVSEFLWEKGYDSIDYLLATHPDADHIGGLTDVLGNFDVKEIFSGGDFSGVEGFDLLSSEAKKRGVPIAFISEGLVLNFGEVELSVLNPPKGRTVNPDNDDSVVFRLVYKTRSFMFTGDIGAETEKRLCNSGLPVDSDVVKVAHHGSRTSSSINFVEKTRAEYAVIPVGKRSPYGHPHQEVVDRWKKGGSKVFLVGESGTISVSTDGSDLRIERFHAP